ncbi:MAG: DUF6473 family protein [Gemmobacter sp.]
MAYEQPGAGALDLFPCRYGQSRLTFRGPRARLDRPYVVALGGTETFARTVSAPWPALVEKRLGRTVANLGCVNAGVDVYLADPSLRDIAAGADLRIVQITGAANLSNPYYTVHPRRNDRFVMATPALRALFPEVDFTEFHFTRHLLLSLARRGPERFAQVADALRALWVDRMAMLLDTIGAPTILLWLAPRPIPAEGDLNTDPVLVDAAMVAAVRPKASDLVVALTDAADAAAHSRVAVLVASALARRR